MCIYENLIMQAAGLPTDQLNCSAISFKLQNFFHPLNLQRPMVFNYLFIARLIVQPAGLNWSIDLHDILSISFLFVVAFTMTRISMLFLFSLY